METIRGGGRELVQIKSRISGGKEGKRGNEVRGECEGWRGKGGARMVFWVVDEDDMFFDVW